MTRIRVKIGAAEAEIEAEPEHLAEIIELIPKVTAKLQGAGVQAASATPLPGINAEGKAEETSEAWRQNSWHGQPHRDQLPVISVEKGDSLADVIGKFFADPWGRERRKLLDVREALQSYGMNYPKQSVAVALLRLAKTTKIRRFKAEDGEFVYTTASALIAPPVPRATVAATLDYPTDGASVGGAGDGGVEAVPATDNSMI